MNRSSAQSFLIFTMLFTTVALAQVDVEKLFDNETLVDDPSTVFEYLEHMLESPLNVNTASAKELCTLPWLSPIVAMRIIQYRHEFGDFKNLEDLQNVFGVSSIYDDIAPFLTTGKHPVSVSGQGRHRIVSRAEESKAFQQHIYRGSKEKATNRFKGTVGEHVHLGLLLEKDTGEKAWNDLSVGHIVVNMPVLSTRLIGGHFSAEFGQGLVFAGPYRMLKGSDPIAPAKQRERGLYPYLSTAENYAFYGVGVSTQLNRFEMHAFSSRQHKDARIVDDQTVSVFATGLHRTPDELSTRDCLREHVNGLVLKTNFFRGHLAALWQKSLFNYPFAARTGTDVYNFSGQTNQVLGVNCDISIGNVNGFAEFAQSKNGGRAVLAGFLFDQAPFEWALLYRNYDIDFNNFYALGFGERPATRNENGLYFGFRYRLKTHSAVCFYFDQWRSPWPRAFVPMPSTGWDLMLSAEHQFSSLVQGTIQCRTEQKDAGVSNTDVYGNAVRHLGRSQRFRVRFQLDYGTHRSFGLRTRLEFSTHSQQDEPFVQDQIGTLLYQDVRWRPTHFLSLQTRWTFFDAPSYDERFYQFENDLPGVMRIKMLNGRGKRWYLLCRLLLTNALKISLKYENLYIDDQASIGSGNDIIFSQYENVISAQLDWQF